MTVEQLRFGGQQDFETIVSAAVKRHREEELQLIKDNLAKIVSDLKNAMSWNLIRVSSRRLGRIGAWFTDTLMHK